MSANTNANLNAGLAHHNPLDRNLDGRVDAKDLLPGAGHANAGVAHHNPLDRNLDGRVDAKDLLPGAGHANSGLGLNNAALLNETATLQAGSRTSLGVIRAEPTVLETIQKETVVHERIHPVQKEEIQPIIYREREQLDVKQVTQMMHETQIQPTLIQQRELPAERREAIVERAAPIEENIHLPTRSVDATARSQVVHAPIVNEIIKKTVIEEIQPVLERDIITSTVIQNTQPIYEKIVEAPTVYRETVVHSQDRGIVGGSLEALAAQGFNLGTFQTTGLNSGLNTGLATSTGLNAGVTNTYTSTEVVGNRRKSLVEALPASYAHLHNGAGLSTDAKLVESEILAHQHANTNASLAAKPLL